MKKLTILFAMVAMVATAWAQQKSVKLSEMITLPNGLLVLTNDYDYTASVGGGSVSGDVVIPATVTHQNHEYKITEIDISSFRSMT